VQLSFALSNPVFFIPETVLPRSDHDARHCSVGARLPRGHSARVHDEGLARGRRGQRVLERPAPVALHQLDVLVDQTQSAANDQ